MGSSAVCCTVCTVDASLQHNRNVRHAGDELKLRHLRLRSLDCRNWSLRSTGTSKTGIPTNFCTVALPPPPPQPSPPPSSPAAATAVKPHMLRTRSRQSRPPHSHQTPRQEPFDDRSARMSWDWRALSHSTGGVAPHFCWAREKCEKHLRSIILFVEKSTRRGTRSKEIVGTAMTCSTAGTSSFPSTSTT